MEASKVPCNSMESIITAFLSCPTSHNQWLEFVGRDIIEKSFRTVSSEFQGSEEFGLYQVAEKRCVSGENKSLSVPVGAPLFLLAGRLPWDYVSRDLICKLLFARIQRLKRPGSMRHVSPFTCLVGLLTFSALLSSWDVLGNVIRASVRYKILKCPYLSEIIICVCRLLLW